MSGTAAISAELRQTKGRRAATRLRADGKVPAIMYGHKLDPEMLAIPETELQSLLRRGAHGLIEIDYAGKKESAVIKEMQWDALGKEILHVDFARVAKGETVHVEVTVVLRGNAAGVTQGGVLDFQLHTVHVDCPAENIIETLRVDVSDLKLDQAILVKDLKLPPGIKVTNDPDLVVVQVSLAKQEAEPGETPAGGVEPELIRREAKVEEPAE
jgi:large subunit ribosomal protein L25